VAGPEFARLNTGVSITRGNSGNGALPTRGSEQDEKKRHVGRVTDARASPPLSGNDGLQTPATRAAGQTQCRGDREGRLTSLRLGSFTDSEFRTSNDYGEIRSVSVSV
jgi:hypothetical protein